MIKVALLAIAICLLAMPVLAIPDNIEVGPYMVYFDLGVLKSDYLIEVSDPITKETLGGDISTDYAFKIRNRIGMMKLANFVMTYDQGNALLPTEDEEKIIINMAMRNLPGAINIQTATRPVDGTFGGVASYDLGTSIGYVRLYSLCYYPTSEGGHLLVTMVSSYSWETETLQLLRTLHVERVFNNTSSTEFKPYVGPTSGYAGAGKGALPSSEGENLLAMP